MKRYLFLLFSLLPFVGNGQIITTVAGTGQGPYNGDNILAINANINWFNGVDCDSANNIFIPDANNYRVRRVDAITGIITTVAGNGTVGSSGDGGLAINAQIKPFAICIGKNGKTLYIAESDSQKIRKVDLYTGMITTVAGNGVGAFSGDGGPATLASIKGVMDMAVDRSGNLFLADQGNKRVRMVDTFGIITTVAGNGTTGGAGDGGAAISAQLYNPYMVDIDTNDDLYIADLGNSNIRKVDMLTGIITTYAGDGSGSYNGEGISAMGAGIAPWGIVFDAFNNLFVSDYGNDRVRRIDAITNTITTVAGNGIQGFSGDGGIASSAQISHPEGVAIDNCGNIYIADFGNKRVRKVTFNPPCFPLNVNNPTPLSFTLYPNPATSQLTITSNTQIKDISITNTLGQQVFYQTSNTQKTIIDIGELTPGIYFLKLTDRYNNTRTEKIIKQ